MKMQVLATVAAVCLAPFASADRVAVTPVQKVIEMLSAMKSKGTQMMDAEAKTFATYSKWVDDRTKDLGFEIIDSEREIEELIAAIEKFNSDSVQFQAKVDELDGDIARMTAEKKDATAVRDEGHAEFLVVEKDYGESVDALERAIQVVSSQQYSRPQAEMLLQKMSKTVPGMRNVMSAFIQQSSSDSQDGAPEVAAYENQGSMVVDMLEGLHKKFKKEYDETVEDEANKAHYYALEMKHLTFTIAESTADREENAVNKAEAVAASVKAQGHLTDTKAELAEDQKVLADMTATFNVKSATYANNQEVRKAELEAISKAIEIMSGDTVSGSYADRINLAQTSTGVAFLQTAASQRRAAVRQSITAMLSSKANSLSSESLATLVKALSGSPFAKVIDMIETLLAKLKEEAAAEATHKQWCDEQLKENKLKRDKKTTQVDKLTAEVEELTSTIADMATKLKTLAKEQSELTQAMAEATKTRLAEKEENLATIADAKVGIEAVKSALVVLREFYATQESLLQASQVPEMAEYKGMGNAKTGVIGMLEVIESDFARLEADTTAAENQAAQEYDAFMAESSEVKKNKHDLEVKTALEKDQTEFEKSQTEKDLKAVTLELEKANEYYEELKPACLEVHVSYEERAAKRQEEIAALKEAYEALGAKVE